MSIFPPFTIAKLTFIKFLRLEEFLPCHLEDVFDSMFHLMLKSVAVGGSKCTVVVVIGGGGLDITSSNGAIDGDVCWWKFCA